MPASAVITPIDDHVVAVIANTYIDGNNEDGTAVETGEIEVSSKDPRRRARIRSLFIVHIAMLVLSLGSSIIYTGVWPYITSMEPNVSLDEYGFVVAADAFAQMIFSPLLGIIADKVGAIRGVCLFCTITFCGGNVFYALLALIPQQVDGLAKPRVWAMLVSRFIVGIGTGINAAARTYISKVTTEEERTTHVSLLSLFQTLGFIMGPAIQSALTPLGEKEISVESNLVFDMYTATGWVSVINGIMATILFLPGIFVEFSSPTTKLGEDPLPSQESEPRKLSNSSSSTESGKVDTNYAEAMPAVPSGRKWPDPIVTFVCTFSFFSFFCTFVTLEVLVTPMAVDHWGWSEEDTILYLGIILAAGGILSGFCFALIGPLSKRFDERILMIVCGILVMMVGRAVMFPFPGNGPPPFDGNYTECGVPDPNITTTPSTLYLLYEEPAPYAGPVDRNGCPYCWCLNQDKMTVVQFIVGMALTMSGYPFCTAIIGSLFSKLLGDIPQGFWMGMLTTSGSLARVVGPIFFTFIYENYGTYLTFGLLIGVLVFTLVLILVFFKRLNPKKSR